MNLLEHLHGRVLIPGFETYIKRRRIFSYWRELERSQWLPQDQLAALQLSRLQALVQAAARHCPYYRDQWSALGLDPAKLTRLADLSQWPVLTRDQVRAHRSEMRSRDVTLRLLSKSTGGSSGTPVQFELDLNSQDRRVAATHRGYSWAGATPGSRQFHLWGVPLTEMSAARRRREEWFHRLHHRRIYNTFNLSESTLTDILRALAGYRPSVLVAYAGALYTLSRMLRERGLTPYSPRSIVVGAEKLHAFQRQLIEEVFAAPVFETYGSREFMLIGAECGRHEGLHLTAEQLLVEVVNTKGEPVGPGEEGEILVTDLFNYGMPFVRYAIGDRGVMGEAPCSCGRSLPLLRGVTGRQSDILTTPDGKRVTGLVFPHLLKDYPAVRQFQVIQQTAHLISLHLVLQSKLEASDREMILRTCREVLGHQVKLELKEVSEIPLTTLGKHRVVVNHTQNAPGA